MKPGALAAAALAISWTSLARAESPHPVDIHAMHDHTMHAMSGPLGLTMSREGSGTGWQPDSTPMSGLHAMAGDWMLMLHYSIFVGYNAQGGARGDGQPMSTNWVMLMAHRPIGAGQIAFRSMLSLEPLTVPRGGYPLLLQTGETYGGVPLHDKQHPHDLFMELAASYTTPITKGIGFQVYLAAAGEPALGPTAFMHRASARYDPLPPLGHHWQDSTHVTFGVLTAGFFTKKLKLEGSWFNGREPDENRYDFDFRAPDSFSGRLTYNPTANVSMQASYGYLKSPENQAPENSLQRVTASVSMNHPVLGAGNLASTFVAGLNLHASGEQTAALLTESALDLSRHHAVYGRAEYVTKTGEDLVLPERLHPVKYRIGTFSLGYLYSFAPVGPLVVGLGARGTVNVVGEELGAFYGGTNPVAGMLYLQLRSAPMKH